MVSAVARTQALWLAQFVESARLDTHRRLGTTRRNSECRGRPHRRALAWACAGLGAGAALGPERRDYVDVLELEYLDELGRIAADLSSIAPREGGICSRGGPCHARASDHCSRSRCQCHEQIRGLIAPRTQTTRISDVTCYVRFGPIADVRARDRALGDANVHSQSIAEICCGARFSFYWVRLFWLVRRTQSR